MENSENFKVMGYRVSVVGTRKVTLMDTEDTLDEDKATRIVEYLFEEGFIDENEEITCEIISN